jgi:anti-anti-sigma factor
VEALEPFGIDVLDRGGRTVVVPRGELDMATTPELERAVLPALGNGRWVVLDLRSLEFIDSSGLRALLSAHRATETGGGQFTVVRAAPGSTVHRVLEIAGLDTIIETVDDPAELPDAA